MNLTPQVVFLDYLARQRKAVPVTVWQAVILLIALAMIMAALHDRMPVLIISLVLMAAGWGVITGAFLKVSENSLAGRKGVRDVVSSSVPVTAHIVQANGNIFLPGRGNFFCLVVLTFDAEAARNPDFLPSLARRLYALKGTRKADPDLREAVKFTSDERAKLYRRQRVPISLTGGVVVYVCDLLLFRSRLRNGFKATANALFC